MRRFRCRRGGTGSAALVAGAIAAGLASGPSGVAAQAKPGSGPLSIPAGLATELQASSGECCLMLLFPIGARRTAMGEAVTSVASPDAVFYNPAGLAEVDDSHFVLHHVATNTLQVDAFTLLFSPGNLATFGVSYELADFGDQDVTQSEIPIGRITFREHILIASFATTIAAGVSAGLNYKYFNQRLACSGQCEGVLEVSAVTHGLDLGMQYRPAWLAPFRFGAALLNLGFPLQVVNSEQADPMPTRLRLGASYDVMRHMDPAGPYRLWLLVEAEEENWERPTSPTTSIGVELSAGDILFLRAGYGGGEGISSGPAVGVGIVYSSFNVAVAKRVSSSGLGDDPFQLTLDIGF